MDIFSRPLPPLSLLFYTHSTKVAGSLFSSREGCGLTKFNLDGLFFHHGSYWCQNPAGIFFPEGFTCFLSGYLSPENPQKMGAPRCCFILLVYLSVRVVHWAEEGLDMWGVCVYWGREGVSVVGFWDMRMAGSGGGRKVGEERGG